MNALVAHHTVGNSCLVDSVAAPANLQLLNSVAEFIELKGYAFHNAVSGVDAVRFS